MSFYKAFDKHGSNAIWMNFNKTQPLTFGQRLRQFMSKS